jgi:hypothetical protein
VFLAPKKIVQKSVLRSVAEFFLKSGEKTSRQQPKSDNHQGNMIAPLRFGRKLQLLLGVEHILRNGSEILHRVGEGLA